jgi:arylsulfatase A-like enzyme
MTMRNLTNASWFIACGLAVGGCESAPSVPPKPAQSSVLIVVIDTLRADAVGSKGAARPLTPQMDAVADAGVRFTDVTAEGSWTWPSHATLFTGVPPWEHGAHFAPLDEPMGDSFPSMRADLPTLAEKFSAAGYQTVSLSANCLLDKDSSLVRGFDSARCLDAPGKVESAVDQLLKQPADKPLFLFVNLMPAHSPYSLTPAPWVEEHRPRVLGGDKDDWLVPYLVASPPGIDLQLRADENSMTGIQAYLGGSLPISAADFSMIRDLYEGEVLEADRRLNTVLSAWTARHGNGVVAVTSDHGEAFGEQGLVDHRSSVYGAVTWIPMIISAPGALVGGTRITEPVQLGDLGDTILDLANIPGPHPRSLLPVVAGAPREGPIQSMAWADPYRASAIGGRFKEDWMLYRIGNEALVYSSSGVTELYDTATDRLMLRDIAANRPDRVKALLKEATEAFPRVSTTAREPLTKEVEQRLKDLGYLE